MAAKRISLSIALVMLVNLLLTACAAKPPLHSFNDLIRAANNQPSQLERVLNENTVGLRLRYICIFLSDRAVACESAQNLLRDPNFTEAEWKLVMILLNESLGLIGANSGDNTLVQCGGRAGLPDAPEYLATTNLTSLQSTSNPTQRLSDPQVASIASTCADMLSASEDITRMTGGQPLGSPAYQQSVQSAVGKVDEAVRSCRDSSANPIAGEAEPTETEPPPTETEPPPTETEPPPTETDETPGTEADEATKRKIISAALAAAATVSMMAEGRAVESPKKATLYIFASLVAKSGSLMGLSDDQQDAVVEAVSVAGDIASVGTGIIDATVLVTLYAGGTLTVGTAILPAIGVAAAGWATYSLGSRALDYFTEEDKQKNKTGGSGVDQPLPAPEGGEGKSCEDIQAAWSFFKEYCDLNNWKSYDCMEFVARANGCVNPAVVNPGPEGNLLICPSERESAVRACETRREAKCMFAKCTEAELNRSCEDEIVGMNREDILQDVLMKAECNSLMPNPEGSGPQPCLESRLRISEQVVSREYNDGRQ